MGLVAALGGRRTYLDTNVFIYALEGEGKFVRDLTDLFTAIESAELPTVTCELTLAELLVKPFREKDAKGEQRCRESVLSRQGLTVVPIDVSILVESARLRAAVGLRLPDAIHIASALIAGCEVFLTNDRRLRAVSGLEVLLLSEVAGA